MGGVSMEVTAAENVARSPRESVIVSGYFKPEDVPAEVRELVDTDFSQAEKRGELKGELYSTVLLHGSRPVLLVGFGKHKDFSDVRCRRAVEAATRYLTRHGFRDIAIMLPSQIEATEAGRVAVESALRGAYDPGLRKTVERSDYSIESLSVIGEGVSEADLNTGKVIGESVNLVRDLVNLPPNEINPTTLSERARDVAQAAGVRVRVLDRPEIEELGMGALLAVSQGSAQPPRVIDLQYGDETADIKLSFVGKGLTFDSGGLSIKTASGMEWMKGDMAGAAAVIGAMRAIGLLRPANVFVRGLVGAVENMIGPASMKPGDVLKTMSGKTIEVLNTDAEGRLVLSDMLAYAVNLGATHIIDLATLTGSAEIALGNEACVVVGEPQEWVDSVIRAAERALERMWQLPLYPEYRRQIESVVADMKNTGGRPGGALTASSLLSEFVDDVPWAHLDIAGTAWVEKANGYSTLGATGYGVATLVLLANAMAV
jgi:leucyl aminopeptidase